MKFGDCAKLNVELIANNNDSINFVIVKEFIEVKLCFEVLQT